MPPASLPNNENARLALLQALQLLDTLPEPAFDRITRLVSRVMNVPAVAVSLIDRDRQWFKSKVGIPATETPRSVAFCSHAILQYEPLVVADARTDARFADNPVVLADPGIRFYAGAPILSAENLALGTLCMFDYQPREFSDGDLQVFRDFADLIRREILNREALLLSGELTQRSEREREFSELQTRAMFDQAAVGMARIGLTGEELQVNRKFCEIVGYSEHELQQGKYRILQHPEDRAADEERRQQLFAGTCEIGSTEKRYVRKDGGARWVNVTSSLVRDGRGEPLYFLNVIEDIQARKEAEEALRALSLDLERQVSERTSELRAVLINSPDAHIGVDIHDRIIDWNPQAERQFGWSAAEIVGQTFVKTLIPEAAHRLHRERRENFLETRDVTLLNRRRETTLLHRDGTEMLVEISSCVLHSLDGPRFSLFVRDISDAKAAEAALRHSREQLRAVADSIPAIVLHMSRDAIVRYANAGLRTLFGIDPAAWEGRNLVDLASPEQRETTIAVTARVLGGESVTHEFYDSLRNKYWQMRLEPDWQDGEVKGYFSIVTDITLIKRTELEHRREAQVDELTGLPNRRALLRHLPETMQRAQQSSKGLGVLFLDLDGFKQINDRLGHDVGDELLRQFAQRLGQCVRGSDMVARLAGDEFVIVAEHLANGAADLQRMALKLTAALEPPFFLAGRVCRVGASIGIKLWDGGETPQALLAAADEAMYIVKRGQLQAVADG